MWAPLRAEFNFNPRAHSLCQNSVVNFDSIAAHKFTRIDFVNAPAPSGYAVCFNSKLLRAARFTAMCVCECAGGRSPRKNCSGKMLVNLLRDTAAMIAIKIKTCRILVLPALKIYLLLLAHSSFNFLCCEITLCIEVIFARFFLSNEIAYKAFNSDTDCIKIAVKLIY